MRQKSRHCEDRRGKKENARRAQAGIFIHRRSLRAALNPRRALLLNFTFLVRKRGPLHSTSKKSIMPRVRMALVYYAETSSRGASSIIREHECEISVKKKIKKFSDVRSLYAFRKWSSSSMKNVTSQSHRATVRLRMIFGLLMAIVIEDIIFD